MPRSNQTNKPKYKSHLREKLGYAEGGRSIGVGGRTAESHYRKDKQGSPTAAKPKSYMSGLLGGIADKIRSAATKRTKKYAKSALAKERTETQSKGLFDVSHPAELIPTIKKARTVAGIVRSIAKK